MTRPQTPAPDAYSAAVADTRARVLAYAAAAWTATTSFDTPSLKAFVSRIVPVVNAGQQRVANLTSAQIARSTGGTAVPVDVDLVTGGRGVPATRVYSRPVVEARTVLSDARKRGGLTITDSDESRPGGLHVSVDEDPTAVARARGGLRLEQLVATDLEMAKIRQADESLKAAGVALYRRVPQGAHTCAMCLIASTKPYKTGNLLPIHPGCDCGVEPIPAGMRLDDVTDSSALLAATHAKVKEFTGIADRGGKMVDYRHLLVTHDHGELGQVLAWRGQNFTGPSDVPRDARTLLPAPVNLDA